MSDKARIIELQKALKIAKNALGVIQNGCRDPDVIAEGALYDMMRLEPTHQLQGLVGHNIPKSRT